MMLRGPRVNNMPSKSLVIVLLLQKNNPFHILLILDLWVSNSRMTPVNRILISTSSFTFLASVKKTTVRADSGSPQFLESLRWLWIRSDNLYRFRQSEISSIVKHYFFLKTSNGVTSARRKDLFVYAEILCLPFTTHRQPTQIDRTSFVTRLQQAGIREWMWSPFAFQTMSECEFNLLGTTFS